MEDTTLIYNGYDVANTLEVFESIWPDTPEAESMYTFAERLFQPLMFMMHRGVLVDFDALEKVKVEVLEEIEIHQADLNTRCGRPLNVNSPKDCQTYFYVEKGIEPYYKTTRVAGQYKKRVTTDDKAMQKIAKGTARRKGIYEAKLVQTLRGLKKLYGTYLDIDYDRDGRFRCSYKPRGTKFGRLSSEKTMFGTGMNMQNLPSRFKSFLVADPNYLMWEMDKKGAEWVVTAYLSGDPNMLKVIEEGLDPHVHTAHLMTGLPKEIIVEENELIGHSADPDEIYHKRMKLRESSMAINNAYDACDFMPRNMSVRQCGKKSNHGLNYDEGPRVFAEQNEMLESEAKKVCYAYKNTVYPGVGKWHKKTVEQLQENRTLVNCFGRSFRFLGRWEEKMWKEAYSFIPQSTVADIVNYGIVDTYEDLRHDMMETELLGQVHDSALGQSLMGDNLQLAKIFQTIGDYMEPDLEYGGRQFTIKNEMKVGFNWKDTIEVDLYSPERELASQIGNAINELKKPERLVI